MKNIRITSCWVLVVCTLVSSIFNSDFYFAASLINFITYILVVAVLLSEVYKSRSEIDQGKELVKLDITMLGSALLAGFGIMGGTVYLNQPEGYTVFINKAGRVLNTGGLHMNDKWIGLTIAIMYGLWFISMIIFLTCAYRAAKLRRIGRSAQN